MQRQYAFYFIYVPMYSTLTARIISFELPIKHTF